MKPSYAFAAVLLLLTACSKEKDVAITKENIAGTYKYVKVTFKPGGNGSEKDVSSFYLPDCEKNNLLTFEVDGDYIYDATGVTCGVDENSIWNLNSTTSISIDGTVFELESFNGSTMIIAHNFDHLGEDGKLKTHLKKQ
jgi:hypothetical protein